MLAESNGDSGGPGTTPRRRSNYAGTAQRFAENRSDADKDRGSGLGRAQVMPFAATAPFEGAIG